MLFIKKNGVHYDCLNTNIRIKGGGWLLVSENIKEKLLSLIPYIDLTIVGDVITDVTDNIEARNLPIQELIEPPIEDRVSAMEDALNFLIMNGGEASA